MVMVFQSVPNLSHDDSLYGVNALTVYRGVTAGNIYLKFSPVFLL